ncbi:MAG: hypothetical protein ACR65U_08575 [Methylocystis sp.]
MLQWFRRSIEWRADAEADARARVERFGSDAYLEARVRQLDASREVDVNRQRRNWERVKALVCKRLAMLESNSII